MKTLIESGEKTRNQPKIPASVAACLPSRILRAVREIPVAHPEEIRLRRERYATVSRGGDNFLLPDSYLSGEEMNGILQKICGGSLYAYRESIAQGFVSLGGGIRVGVAGRAFCEGEKILGVTDIASLVFRLPYAAALPSEPISALFRQRRCGILIFSPPGVGKTTLLRAVAEHLSDPTAGEGAFRTAVIDTRGELYCSPQRTDLCLDVLSGYPRSLGISVALRCLNPQVMICDEIGDAREACEILNAGRCGVPLIASAHGDNRETLIRRPGFDRLDAAGIFGLYVRLGRDEKGLTYDVKERGNGS